MVEATSRPMIDLGRLAPGLGHTCSDYHGTYRERLADSVQAGEGGVAVVQMHASILDGLLGALFCAADAAVRVEGLEPTQGSRVALVAVGGYGRSSVGLASDIDVLFLCDDPSDRYVGALAEGVLYPLWDLGLDIGHAVRGIDESLTLAQDDLSTATTLLDMRRIGGDKTILHELAQRARNTVFRQDPAADAGLARFLDQLEEDRVARHERFGGSPHLLEPEVKLGCGGLRDFDIAVWCAKARWGVTDTESLVKHGALLAREVEALENAKEMLWRVRNLLHLRAGRRQDRLTFEDQEEIAVQLGFVPGVMLAVEQFMQAYYRHVTTVEQTAELMIARARQLTSESSPVSEDLGDGLVLVDHAVALHDPERLGDDPALALRLFAEAIRRNVAVHHRSRDAVARKTPDRAWAERLRASDEAAKLWLRALRCTSRLISGSNRDRTKSVLAELHQLGVLLAMIPEFEPVTGRVQHDVYHVYTVDVHSVAAVGRLAAIKRGDYASELPLASRLAAELPRPEPLFLGLLLHDIGKAHGKDHSSSGARMAGPIASRLGMTPIDVAHVVWLVQEHLSLYHWATRRDTTDPEVIGEISERVGTIDRLRDLYLLTVADLSTTNPNAMTSWKARMLEDLYVATSAVLEGEELKSAERRADTIRDEVCAGLTRSEDLQRFVRAMPDRYLLANPIDAIREHAMAALSREEMSGNGSAGAAYLALREGPSADVSEMLVLSQDRPGLLAAVAAALAAQRLTIVSAQIYTRDSGEKVREAFDVFHVRRVAPVAGDEPVDEAKLDGVREDLDSILSGATTASALLADREHTPEWAKKHSPDVPTEIQVDNEASARFTVIDIFTRDRPALLFTIAQTLHEQGLTIGLSKVNTEGDRAADVFYVLDASGEKVRDPERLRRLPGILEAALETLE